jgi:hypothetical protein
MCRIFVAVLVMSSCVVFLVGAGEYGDECFGYGKSMEVLCGLMTAVGGICLLSVADFARRLLDVVVVCLFGGGAVVWILVLGLMEGCVGSVMTVGSEVAVLVITPIYLVFELVVWLSTVWFLVG